MTESRTQTRTRLLLGGLLAFGALNAFAGGFPSLILFGLVGGMLALAAVMVFRRHRLARAAGLLVLLLAFLLPSTRTGKVV